MIRTQPFIPYKVTEVLRRQFTFAVDLKLLKFKYIYIETSHIRIYKFIWSVLKEDSLLLRGRRLHHIPSFNFQTRAYNVGRFGFACIALVCKLFYKHF